MNARTIYLCILLVLPFVALSQVSIQKTDIKCNGQRNGKATVTIGTAPGPYKITWLHNSLELAQYRDKMTAAGLEAGNYTIMVKDKNDCMIQRTFEIKEPPSIEISITSSTGAFDYCGSKSFPDVTLYAEHSGGTPPRTCSAASCLKRVSGPGEYSFTVSDANGCHETKSIRVNWVGLFCPLDPNDIQGPMGYGTPKWLAASQPVQYTVRFENDPELATAPAQHVLIEHTFDPHINPFSLRLGNFGFGDFVYPLDFTTSFHQERLDFQSELGIYVDVVAGLDITQNRAFWSFQTIDPATGQPPVDPLVGFLPVNDTLIGNGEGFVTFTVTPKSNVNTGDIAAALATIHFDDNEEVPTNTWTNTLDAHAPVSVLHALDSLTTNTLLQLSWSASDDAGGCGIRDYDVFVQTDSTPVTLVGEGIVDTFVLFQGLPGHTYGFYVVATDHVGNRETKSGPEQVVTIPPVDAVDVLSPLSGPRCTGDSLTIQWRSYSIDSLQLSFSIDSGQHFTVIEPLLEPSDSIRYLWLADSLVTPYAQFAFRSLEDTSVVFYGPFFSIHPSPEILIAGNENSCAGDPVYLLATGGNSYAWIPGASVNDSTSAYPTVYPDSVNMYVVRGTDVYGCHHLDSIIITVHPVYLDSLVYEMCDGDSVFVGGAYQTEGGFYTDSLATGYGCDSTVITQVVITGICPFPSPQVYVDKDAVGLNNGTSWANAFTHLTDALQAVDYYENVREIWIAEGTYYTSDILDRDTSFVLRDSVTVYGGFLGVESNRNERVLDASLVKLSGDIGIPNDSTDNAFHVIRVDTSCADCILDGLTISFGHANGVPPGTSIGAGMLVEGKVMLADLVIERNTTLLEGAAIYNTGVEADLTIKDCLFRLNTSGLERDILNGSGAKIMFQGLNTIQD